MISDSSYWKRTLAKHAETLHAKTRQRRWREESYLVVEQSAMLSCYIVRKLAEAHKITEKRYEAPVLLTSFAATGKTVNALNNHRLDEFYDVEQGQEVSRPLSYVVNQLIHSYIFAPVFLPRNRLHAVVFNSDRSRTMELYLLMLRPFAQVLAACADSALSSVGYYRIVNGELQVIPRDGTSAF